jgi:hypothetical protein
MCRRSQLLSQNLKGTDAGVNKFLGLRSKLEGENRHGGRLPAQPGRQEAGCNNFLGLLCKPKAQKRHGCRFWAAQGIEAEIPEAPRPYPHAKRVD